MLRRKGEPPVFVGDEYQSSSVREPPRSELRPEEERNSGKKRKKSGLKTKEQ